MLEQKAHMRRLSMLDGRREIRHGDHVLLRILPAAARFVLRLDAAGLERVGNAASLKLTQPINHWLAFQGGMSVRLGPDEWLLLPAEEDLPADAARLESAMADQHYALIDIGHRNIGFELVGIAAADVLNSGCPLDLGFRQFPPGRGTRTLLGKAEIVLLRLPDVTGAGGPLPAYRIECWRSVGRYVYDFLEEAARQHATSE